jgi:hypothetical protein
MNQDKPQGELSDEMIYNSITRVVINKLDYIQGAEYARTFYDSHLTEARKEIERLREENKEMEELISNMDYCMRNGDINEFKNLWLKHRSPFNRKINSVSPENKEI